MLSPQCHTNIFIHSFIVVVWYYMYRSNIFKMVYLTILIMLDILPQTHSFKRKKYKPILKKYRLHKNDQILVA